MNRLLPLAVGALSCVVAAGGKSDRVSSGSWGGRGVGLEVTEDSARLEFDCAHGAIERPIPLDAEGRFDAQGMYFREHGGPVREGEPKGVPARYAGRVEGETMHLTVTVAGSDEPIGRYTIARGKPPRIRKCL